jgi:hypothetical protein
LTRDLALFSAQSLHRTDARGSQRGDVSASKSLREKQTHALRRVRVQITRTQPGADISYRYYRIRKPSMNGSSPTSTRPAGEHFE